MLKLPVNLIEIATNCGIEVFSKELPKGVSGAIKYNSDDKNFQILLEKTDVDKRKRFTLAHELAHFFMDRDSLISDIIHVDVLYRKENTELEKKADYVAGALLMPKVFIEKLYKSGYSIKELASLFEVSESAVTVRLMVLDLI